MRFLTTPLLRTRARAPFLLLVALTACGTLGMHVIIPALPATARAMGISIGSVQLTITLYLIGLAAGQLLYGPLSDRFGRRPVLLAGMTLFTLASAATALAPTPGVLIGARVLQSIGGCAGLVLGRAAVRDGSTPDKAAGQLALLTVTMSVVPAIAPAIGGFLTAFVHWRASYFLLVAIGAATLLATLLLLPETNLGPRGPLSFGRGYSKLLLSPTFLGYAGAGALTTTSFYGFMAAAPFIFENHLHQPTQDVGLYYLLLMVGVATGATLANRLSRRVTLRTGLRIANLLAICGAVCFMTALLTGHLTVVTVVASIALFMVGGGMASPFALAGSVSANPQAIGAASGLYGFFQMGYGMICTIVVESWDPGSVFPVAAILLGSSVTAQMVLLWAAHRGRIADRALP
jgi:DHA1 family bicyclomycin/chloramphenicol resistance-like MFS transporter